MARIPKPMTKRRIRNITTHYLSQRTTTRGHLRRLLMNRVRKSLRHHEGDETEIAGWVDAVLDDVVAQGLVNDRRWATSRLERLRRRGMSERAIRAKLREKLVAAELIDELLSEGERQDPLDAAVLYARRRSLGPFRSHSRDDKRDKDLAKLARAGFPYAIANQVLELEPDEAEDRAITARYG